MKTHLVLQRYVERKRRSKRGFSIRGLASDLELSPSFLSRVLSGKKPIPYALLLKLAKALDIEAEVVTTLKKAHQVSVEDDTVPKRGRAEAQMPLDDWELAAKDAHRVLRSWFYVPLLELTLLPDFDGSPQMIADRLGLSRTTVEVALRDLSAMGLIELEGGRAKKKAEKIRFSSSTTLEDIRRFHGLMLEKAQQELKTATHDDDFKRRLITGITLTASSARIEEAKKKLSDCLHEIANELIQEPGTDVYHLSAQLFPLTKAK